MKTEQMTWTAASGWQGAQKLKQDAQIVIAFGGIDEIHTPSVYPTLSEYYPNADILLASTAGEISGTRVRDNSIVVTAIHLEKTKHKLCNLNVGDFKNSFDLGKAIQQELLSPDLRHVLIISEGTNVNGDQLSKGINDGMPNNVIVTGGLAGDAGRLTKTYVGVNGTAEPLRIGAIGFYGDSIKVSHGSQGGWHEFGPIRKVTQSEGNVLLSLDGTPALEVYKKYLGEKASELPGAALLFPLCILGSDGSRLVRTILGIDEAKGSMTFAGDIPQGANVQFMMSTFDRLIDGATHAAEDNLSRLGQHDAELVLMVSCVGRKLVLSQRIEEEVEAVHELFGDRPVYFGFYSNGEISPLVEGNGCSLHNQTMTITTYTEI
jgi:hypothetical protein